MSVPCSWRLAVGASASVLLTTAQACDGPTAVAPTRAAATRLAPATAAAPCDADAMPTYALTNATWRRGGRVEARTLYLERGALRERAGARDTLDLRGLVIDVRDGAGGAATFVGTVDDAVALRVVRGCFVW